LRKEEYEKFRIAEENRIKEEIKTKEKEKL